MKLQKDKIIWKLLKIYDVFHSQYYGIHSKFKRMYDVLRCWGQEDLRVKKLDDLMPINVTVTNSGKITLTLTFISLFFVSALKTK